MTLYNYSQLSPHDFELLCRDVLHAEYGWDLRAYAAGRDGGVDLRAWFAEGPRESVVVQCKHMEASSFTSLRSRVRAEKTKLDGMQNKPSRYVLVTSKGLTERNIESLLSELAPYCLSSEDVIDVIRLEQILSKHDHVLRSHAKLWISSAPTLENMIYAATLTNSVEFIAQARVSARTFVRPRTMDAARDILKSEHACVISGEAGAGKTTLAAMLALDYLAQDFSMISIEEDIREADALYRDTERQIFLYDDFLGRNDPWQKLGKNEDSRILRFMHRVKGSSRHRFILTTREYILRSALPRYEHLSDDTFASRKCILTMDEYSVYEKGLILYNHLYFANAIPSEEIQDLVDRRSYREIIEHRNYSPRTIVDALAGIVAGRARE